jgi:hypothetical protein
MTEAESAEVLVNAEGATLKSWREVKAWRDRESR